MNYLETPTNLADEIIIVSDFEKSFMLLAMNEFQCLTWFDFSQE